ncbi:MAG: hypothetical protein Q4D55_03625 [Eubacteriales bacterium]|nr:hypothetical protein [Eubacteriales bacterium]
MKKGKIVYCVLFFAICLFPLVGLAVRPAEESTENRDLAEFPSIWTEEGLNTQWMSMAGDYFQDHFAFRRELVTANAVLKGRLLGVSTASGVIQGTNGWLYYKDSLEDYQGTGLLPGRSIFNISHTLSMVQEYLEGKGVAFVFAAAPNKNSLYQENMPYYYRKKASAEKNLLRLEECLWEEGVSYVDLYGVFSSQEEVLYHKRDSHWNNKGAAMAADLLLTALGQEHDSYEAEPYEVRADFEGDLDTMLYPAMVTLEEEIYYTKEPTFAYVGEVESNFAPRIHTVNPVKGGSLVMYRDSFGNAVLPFMADAYGSAYFSRGVPYQLGDVDTMAASGVAILRAERFLPDMAQSPPVMEGPAVVCERGMIEKAGDGALDVAMTAMGNLVKLTGRIREEYLDERTRIYLRINEAGVYEAFPMDVRLEDGTTDEGGFCLYLPAAGLRPGENTLEVAVRDQEEYHIISRHEIKEDA